MWCGYWYVSSFKGHLSSSMFHWFPYIVFQFFVDLCYQLNFRYAMYESILLFSEMSFCFNVISFSLWRLLLILGFVFLLQSIPWVHHENYEVFFLISSICFRRGFPCGNMLLSETNTKIYKFYLSKWHIHWNSFFNYCSVIYKVWMEFILNTISILDYFVVSLMELGK